VCACVDGDKFRRTELTCNSIIAAADAKTLDAAIRGEFNFVQSSVHQHLAATRLNEVNERLAETLRRAAIKECDF
jgi:hypothetical protein